MMGNDSLLVPRFLLMYYKLVSRAGFRLITQR